MSHILGLKFRAHGPVYYFASGAFVVAKSDHVLVKTEQGMGLAEVTQVLDEPPPGLHPDDIKPIYRLADTEDLAQHEENLAQAREAFRHCRECIQERKLDMRLVDVEIFHDRGKMVFYFTAPGRIDFRELVKDLVKAYHTRIELRQIGVRHETQMIGAIGNCGQICCCKRFIRKFSPVTIKMAKDQNLFLNPAKISGMCGRLLCCLGFEQSNYEEFQAKCPKIGKRFQTSQGAIKVVRTNLFRETVTVIGETGGEKDVSLEEWTALRREAQEIRQDQFPPRQERDPRHLGEQPRDDAAGEVSGEPARARPNDEKGQPGHGSSRRGGKHHKRPKRPGGRSGQAAPQGESGPAPAGNGE